MRHLFARCTPALAALLSLALLAACGDDDDPSNNDDNNGGLCENVTCDAPPAAECDGDEAVVFGDGTCDAADGTCDYVETERTDCAASDMVCEAGECVDPAALCDDVTCDAPPAPICEGTEVVTYGDGVCDDADGTCDYTEVDRVDCADTDQICEEGACVDVDLCTDVTCDTPPAAVCEGTEVVTYGDGVCDVTDGTCDYTEVTRVDCATTDETCVDGACVAPADPTVTPGDLVVSEVFYDASNAPEPEGEWFEVYNPTNRTLDLTGLEFSDLGSNAFTVTSETPIEIAPGDYFIFGRTDAATNGGVAVDYVYGTAYSLSNTDDEIIIFNPDPEVNAEIDMVAWDEDNGWPVASGASLQFGSENDLAVDDNTVATYWCPAATLAANNDFGTPGAANDACAIFPRQTLTISAVQDPATAPVETQAVLLEDVVITAINDTDGIWVQDPTGGAYSGIYVSTSFVDTTMLAVGEAVDIEGVYTENAGSSELEDLSAIRATLITEQAITPAAVVAEIVTTDQLATDPESWESVLIRVIDAGVTEAPNGFNEFVVNDVVLVDDLLFPYTETPASYAIDACDYIAGLTGVLDYRYGGFKIVPRDATDFPAPSDVTLATAPDVVMELTGFAPDTLCVEAGTTVTWTNPTALAHTATEDDATPLFDVALPANGGTGSFTFADAGLYPYLSTPVPTMEGRIIVIPAATTPAP